MYTKWQFVSKWCLAVVTSTRPCTYAVVVNHVIGTEWRRGRRRQRVRVKTAVHVHGVAGSKLLSAMASSLSPPPPPPLPSPLLTCRAYSLPMPSVAPVTTEKNTSTLSKIRIFFRKRLGRRQGQSTWLSNRYCLANSNSIKRLKTQLYARKQNESTINSFDLASKIF